MNAEVLVSKIEVIVGKPLTLLPEKTIKFWLELQDNRLPIKQSPLMRFEYKLHYSVNTSGELNGLNLCQCNITKEKLDDLFSQLFNEIPGRIEHLNLSENDISSINLDERLNGLKYFDLSDNKNLKKCEFSSKYSSLVSLDLNECGLDQALQLPRDMKNLVKLDVSRNKSLPSIDFQNSDCHELVYLDLSDNNLKELELPDGFQKLLYLYLNNNKIRTLKFSTPLTKLKTLNLKNNDLEKLPNDLLAFNKLETLYLYGNKKIEVPADILPQDENESALNAVKSWLLSIEDEPVENDEVKLVLLGNSTVGKTSLLKFLATGKFDENEKSTHGIINIIVEKENLNFKINAWDFGGQEYYHATHRLFLSRNALSLVVFDEETNFQGEREEEIGPNKGDSGSLSQDVILEHFHYSYWVSSVKYFSDDEEAVIRLLQNKIDLSKRVRLDDSIFMPISVQESYNKDPEHLAYYNAFETKLFKELDAVRGKYKLSSKWIRIKDRLRELGQEILELSLEDYKKECESISQGITHRFEFDTITDYLHNIGAILYFKKPEYFLNTVFLNPSEIANIIYLILDYSVYKNNGEFDDEHVSNIVHKYNEDRNREHKERDKGNGKTSVGTAYNKEFINVESAIRLMQKFYIVFKLSESRYVAPQYLPKSPPIHYDSAVYKKLRPTFVIRYPDFLPRSVMTQFICRMGNSKSKYWKHGIVFEKEEATILVENKGMDIFVKVDSRTNNKYKFASSVVEIFNCFKEINDKRDVLVSKDGFQFIKMSDYNRFADFSSKIPNAIPEEPGLDVSIFKDLFTEPAPPKIYISYSLKDNRQSLNKDLPREKREYLDKFSDDMFIELKNQNYNVIRDVDSNPVGKEILKFMEELVEGDIIVCIISRNYFKSMYCMFELKAILEKYQTNDTLLEKHVVFVRLDDSVYDPKYSDAMNKFWETELKFWQESILDDVSSTRNISDKFYNWANGYRNNCNWIHEKVINSVAVKPLIPKIKYEIDKRLGR